jgi:hypothetical protein
MKARNKKEKGHENKEQDKSRRMAYDSSRSIIDKGASCDAPDPSPFCSSADGNNSAHRVAVSLIC